HEEKKDSIYWSDEGLDRIETCSFDGEGRQVIIADISSPIGLTIHGQHIYWTKYCDNGTIERADKKTGNNRKVIKANIEKPIDVKIVSRSKQSGTNPCGIRHGGCSH